ncbi:MAG: nucleotide exchange factor GrpE [Prevotella sp.]|nr:nucleotide exchange factor GrpE [Prevotella sp.]MDY5666918.1 nucleotide exchange factor GrpE [Alloprevotella sp.]
MKKEEKENKEINEQATAQNAATEPQEAEKDTKLTDAEKLDKANDEIAQLKDKYLRQVAEFDNYRKRTLKEKTELILNGGQKVLEALLPILDDLDRAAENINKSNDVATLKEGVDLIINKLNKTLSAQGLQRMDTIGKAFDTDFHEAVALIPAQNDEQKNHIIDCVQPGYLLNDKVIRHAKVVVGQ